MFHSSMGSLDHGAITLEFFVFEEDEWKLYSTTLVPLESVKMFFLWMLNHVLLV